MGKKINFKLSTDYLLYIWKNNVLLLYATCNIQCKIDMYLRIRVPSKKKLRIRETRAAAPTFVVTSMQASATTILAVALKKQDFSRKCVLMTCISLSRSRV